MSFPARPRSLDRRRSYLGQYAGFASRLVAFTVDVIVISVILLFSGWFIQTSMSMMGIEAFLLELSAGFPVIQTVFDFIFGPFFTSLVSLVFIIFYYLFFWMAAGQTPGKYLMGVKVVALDGPKIKLRHAALRYLGYYLSALPLGIGFLWILVDDQRRGWHDRFARTCVIYTWDARPDENFLVRATHELNARREALQAYIKRQRGKQQD